MQETPKRPQKAVVDGKPTYTSASSLQTADPNTSGGCPRKWYFGKVLGLKAPPTKSQAVGTKVHAEIEHYLKTGELTLGQIAMAGKHLIPEPHPHQLIEHRIWHSQLAPAGIPIEGYIDLVVPPPVCEGCDNLGCSKCEGTLIPEVIDWKTTSNIKWAKRGSDLPETIQMGIYAKWAQDFYEVDEVRLSHVYFQTKGRPQALKSTILVGADKIRSKWESIEEVARSLHQLAAETEISKVPANRASCDAFGGCPFYSQCPRTATEVFDMSVLDNLAARNISPSSVTNIPAGFVKAWTSIIESGRGVPPLGGEAERAAIAVGMVTPAGGELGGLPTLEDPEVILVLAAELEAEAAKACSVEPEPPAVLPPDAPESDPELAALPVRKDIPLGVMAPAEAKKLKKGDLGDAYETCFAELMSRVPGPGAMQSSVAIREAGTAPSEASRQQATPEPTIYVNCLPPSPCDRLEPYIFATAGKLAESAGEADIRCSKKDILAFGKWKGALAAAVREAPPVGSFTVACKGDEFAEVVVNALEGTHQIVRGF